jgi:dynein heavy chain
LAEARDINRHLSPLRQYVEALTNAPDFMELQKIYPKLLYMLVLAYSNCTYYASPERVSVLLEEICNDVVEQVMSF